MSATKDTGLNGISCKLFNIIAPHIVNICNASINNAQFPRSWKKARLLSLYKFVMNYRPIYGLLMLSKPLEQHVHNHLHMYLT